MKLGYLYVIQKKYHYRCKCKIGSTKDFEKRMGNYVTPEPYFNNDTHNIWCITLIKSEWNCYQLDRIIQCMSIKHQIPYIKLVGDGGIEHYEFDNIGKLVNFLKQIEVEFEIDKINVDKLRKDISKFKISECKQLDADDAKKIEIFEGINSDMIKRIEGLLNIKKFTLKQYQRAMIDQISKIKESERLYHLVISPTGTGKTVVFSAIAFNEIEKTKKDVMIIIKRKEILSQINGRIKDYLIKFKQNGITDLDENDVKIVDCLNECTIDKLNSASNKKQIFLVNFDKFTSSKKMRKYKKINFEKFGMIIVDESHWCGAEKIYNFMSYIKEQTKVNVIGFSATPLRCQRDHRQRTEQLFSTKYNVLNIAFEYSYYDALVNEDICPIKWKPISMLPTDFVDYEKDDDDVEDDDLEKSKQKSYKVLNEKSYGKIYDILKKEIIDISFRKKGIVWFRRRVDLLMFYKSMKNNFNGFKLFCTFSYEPNDQISKLVEGCGLDKQNIENSIKNFVKENSNALLFAVNRAIEGFDDDKIDFGVRMYYGTMIDPVTETQRMGRLNRWYNNDPIHKKEGYFVTLEINDTEEMRKSIIFRLKSWVMFARSYDKFGKNGVNNNEKEKQIIEILNKYIDANILKIHHIDLKADIINAILNKRNDKNEIRLAIIKENKNRQQEGKQVINTKYVYDEWAELNGYPICDELEEMGINDFKWLFGMNDSDYVSWSELVRISHEYWKKYGKKFVTYIGDLYKKMMIEQKKRGINIPYEPEIYYEKNFVSFMDLFNG